jgi:hypothetical protein
MFDESIDKLDLTALSFDRINRIFQDFFFLSHFPDGSEKTQSAFSGI